MEQAKLLVDDEHTKVVRIKESIAVPLTREQLHEKAELAAKLHEEITETENDAKESAAEFKAAVATLKNKQSSALRCIRTGKEFLTDVPCDQVFKLQENLVELWYDGQKISSREMTAKERDLLTPTVFDYAAAQQSIQRNLPADEEVKAVIKEETNRKTKKDLMK